MGLLYRHLPLRAMAWYRFACWCREKRIPALYGLITHWIFFRFKLELWGDIGGGLYIAHTAGSVIGVERIGESCSVIAAVTVGMRNEWAFPSLGDNVFIGAGARVLGDIHVGDHAKIGANAVIIQDVPTYATVVGVPGRIISQGKPPSAVDDFTDDAGKTEENTGEATAHAAVEIAEAETRRPVLVR